MGEADRRDERGGSRVARVLLGVCLALMIPVAAWLVPTATTGGARSLPELADDRAPVARAAAAPRWTPTDVVYRSARRSDGSSVDLYVNVYGPSGDANRARPVVVVLHPGGFAFGDRTDPGTVALAQQFAARGYVAITPDYRTRPDWDFTMDDAETLALGVADARDDVLASIDWIEEHAPALGVDPTRVAVVGRSAGAMTALALASDDVTAVVSSAGCWVGGPELSAASAPALLIHGSDDTVVPPSCAEETAATATAGGERVELLILPGVWHEATEAEDQWWDAVEQHFREAGLAV